MCSGHFQQQNTKNNSPVMLYILSGNDTFNKNKHPYAPILKAITIKKVAVIQNVLRNIETKIGSESHDHI